jgi:GNAT superfamily N-acetyltransferase
MGNRRLDRFVGTRGRSMTREQGWVSSTYSPQDAQDTIELLHRALGDTEAAAPAYREWQCQRGPAGAAVGALAREAQTAHLIGQAVAIPTKIRLSGRVFMAGLSLEPVSDPAYQDRGLVADLLRGVCDLSAGEGMALTYGLPGQDSYRTYMGEAGFKGIGSVPLLVRPLDPERLAMKTTGSRVLARTASVARRIWRTPAPVPWQEALPGLEIEEVDSFGGSFAIFWERVQHRFPVMVVRDPAYLNWRFVDVPVREYARYAARSEGIVRGFVVLRTASLGRFSAGLIVDLIVEPSAEGRAAGRLLIDRAYSHFKEQDLDLVAALSLRHTDEFRLLRSRGFWASPRFLEPRPFRLVVRCHDEEPSPRRMAYLLKNWFVTMGDFDVG